MSESSFGRRLGELRRAAGMTQAALAEAAGLSKNYIADVEQGRYPDPSLSTLLSLAAALGKPLKHPLLEPPTDAPSAAKKPRGRPRLKKPETDETRGE